MKERFGLAASGWNALSDTQKRAWVAWATTQRRTEADTKTTYSPTGFNGYSSLALVWLAANENHGTPPATPPLESYSGDSISLTAQAEQGSVVFSGSGSTEPATLVECWLQRLPNASRKPLKNGYRVVGYATLDQNGENKFTVSTQQGNYAARFRFVNKLTGQRSTTHDIVVKGVVT